MEKPQVGIPEIPPRPRTSTLSAQKKVGGALVGVPLVAHGKKEAAAGVMIVAVSHQSICSEQAPSLFGSHAPTG